jgi:hypothetical protein
MSDGDFAGPFKSNPLHGWLRVILWLIPISFTVPGAALMFLGRYLGLNDAIITGTGYFSFFFCLIGAGWCDFKLAGPGWKESFTAAGSAVFYTFCQLILVTIIFIILLASGILQ